MASEAVARLPKIFKRLRQYPYKKRPRTYIVPTVFGLIFAILCLFLFMLAAGSGNNLIYGYVFLIISIALMGTYLTNRNIDNLSFSLKSERVVFAGENNTLHLFIENKSSESSVELQIRVGKEKNTFSISEIQAAQKQLVKLSWVPNHRGHCLLPRVQIQSTFPFGFLRAWHLCRAQESYLVFPKREGVKKLLLDTSNKNEKDLAGLFKGYDLFQSSDSSLRVDWRVSARKQELYVKKFENYKRESFNFSLDQTRDLFDIEKRISQLALWVDEAEKAGYEYSLKFGDTLIQAGHGEVHWEKCMKALALWSPTESDET